MTAPHRTETHQAALDYAALGVPVIALHTPTPRGCTCRLGSQCSQPGKHPRFHVDRRQPERSLLANGLHDATTDPHLIGKWWARWPGANVAMRTGIVFDVIDIDSAEGLDALRDLLGDIQLGGPAARSGGGGWHLYVAPTGYGNRVDLLPGVDFRGANGQIVAPPSKHSSGQAYRWCRPLGAVPLPDCPDALLKLLCPPPPVTVRPAAPVRDLTRYATTALEQETDRVLSAQPGTRNDCLNRAAYNLGKLAGGGVLEESDVVAALTAAALQIGLGHAETARTIGSGLRAGRARPRTPELRKAA